MRRSRPVIGWTLGRACLAALFVMVLAVGLAPTVMFLVRDLDWSRSWPGLLLWDTVVAVWLTGVWRLMNIGIYRSPTGVHVRRLLRSRTYAWSSIDSVEAAPALLFGLPTSRMAIWLHLADGEQVELPMQSRRQAESSTNTFTKNTGPVVRQDVFDSVLHELSRSARTRET